jgi:hypothetical protein
MRVNATGGVKVVLLKYSPLSPSPVTGAALTVIAEVAVLLPSAVVTVIVADPVATPVTTPAELTVATELLDVVQLTVLTVALEGATVAVKLVVAPTFTVAEVGLTVTPVTAIAFTVMADVAVKLPSAVVTVIVAEPVATPVTTPAVLTEATALFEVVHVTALFVALEGRTVAVKLVVAPMFTLAEVGLTVTPVTGIVVTIEYNCVWGTISLAWLVLLHANFAVAPPPFS